MKNRKFVYIAIVIAVLVIASFSVYFHFNSIERENKKITDAPETGAEISNQNNNLDSRAILSFEDLVNYQVDVPGEVVLYIKIPKIVEEYPDIDNINKKIEQDFAIIINAVKQNSTYSDVAESIGVTYYKSHYEVFEFDGIYEICVMDEVGDAAGSGLMFSHIRYYYDADSKVELSEDEFLERLGISQNEILNQFKMRAVEEGDSTDYTYDLIDSWYYINQDREIIFNAGLYS